MMFSYPHKSSFFALTICIIGIFIGTSLGKISIRGCGDDVNLNHDNTTALAQIIRDVCSMPLAEPMQESLRDDNAQAALAFSPVSPMFFRLMKRAVQCTGSTADCNGLCCDSTCVPLDTASCCSVSGRATYGCKTGLATCCGLDQCCETGSICGSDGKCVWPSITVTQTSTIVPTTTSSVIVTSTNFITQTSTTKTTAVVFSTVSNVETATIVDTVTITKRAVPLSTSPSLSQREVEREQQFGIEIQEPRILRRSSRLRKRHGEIGQSPKVLLKRATTITIVVTRTVTGAAVTVTNTIAATVTATTTVVRTEAETSTSTVAIGARATQRVRSTITVAQAEASRTTKSQTNIFTITGAVVPALSTLRNLVPQSAQTDPAAACFLQNTYSVCYTTPSWWSSVPADSQSYYSSANSGNDAACTSCPASGGGGGGLSTGAKAGIGIGVAGAVIGAAVLVMMAIKAGLFRSAPKAVGSTAASTGAQAPMAQSALGAQAASQGQAGWSGATGHPNYVPAMVTGGGLAGAAGGAALAGHRQSDQSFGRRPIPSSVASQDSRISDPSLNYQSSTPNYQLTPQSQHQLYQPYQSYGHVAGMGQPDNGGWHSVSPSEFHGQGPAQAEVAGRQVYESDARELRRP